jgi:hypothetical protein
MLAIPFNKLTSPSARAFVELRLVYEALLNGALREQNLRAFLEADLTLASLDSAKYVLEQPCCSPGPAYYLKAEPGDSVGNLLQARRSLRDRPPVGWAPPAG